MSPSGRHPAQAPLKAREAQRKKHILTQPEPSRVRENRTAVVLKEGNVFFLSQQNGDVPWRLQHAMGLYFRDCRFLDGYELRLNGEELTLLSSDASRGYEAFHELANPELAGVESGEVVAKGTIAVRRERRIRGGVLHERITLHNYGRAPASLALELRFRSYFQDIFIIKGFVSGPRGEVEPPRVLADQSVVELRYRGRDGLWRATALAFTPSPTRLEPGRASFDLTLAPGQERVLALSIAPSEHQVGMPGRTPARPHVDPALLRPWLECAERIWLESAARVRASNPLFERVMRRALLDLRMLRSRLERQHFFAAGIPWFATLFGRDALICALQTLPYGPAMARDTLRLLARLQATTYDLYRDAEPGKILHEYRGGELARLGAIPQHLAYYGSVDATLLFLVLLTEYVNWSADLKLARDLLPNVERALGWIEQDADHDGDGYLDYLGEYETGLINQGWKDSGNAIVDADGSLARPPIALCEVQAYTYRAWRQVAALLRELNDPARADELEARARDLRARFERDFWSDELGCYVLGLQRGGEPLRVVSSNSGQVLWGGIASPERAARVAERLFAEDMFSGWGVRTLSSREVAFNPISYHLGSVWPHDNALIAAGLRRYGHDEAALRLFTALFEAVSNFPDYRMPELYCGYQRRSGQEEPVRYPVACSPQAWAAGALPHALWNLLGLRPDALQCRLRLVRPRLPTWLDWVELRGTRIGSALVDLRFERVDSRGAAIAQVVDSSGELRVETVDHVPAEERFV